MLQMRGVYDLDAVSGDKGLENMFVDAQVHFTGREFAARLRHTHFRPGGGRHGANRGALELRAKGAAASADKAAISCGGGGSARLTGATDRRRKGRPGRR